jgi:hypothetical protein
MDLSRSIGPELLKLYPEQYSPQHLHAHNAFVCVCLLAGVQHLEDVMQIEERLGKGFMRYQLSCNKLPYFNNFVSLR